MASLDQLLVLQEHDTVLDQLRHRRATLPQRAEAESIRADLERGGAAPGARWPRPGPRWLGPRSGWRTRWPRWRRRWPASTASSTAAASPHPAELQALQDDENALKRHQSAVEDKVIEQMELAVPLDEQADELAARRAGLEADETRLAAELAAAEADIDAEVAGVDAERAEIAGRGRSRAARALRGAAARPGWHRRGPPGRHQLRWLPPHPVGGRAGPHPSPARGRGGAVRGVRATARALTCCSGTSG